MFASDHDGIEASSLVGQDKMVSPTTASALSTVADVYFYAVAVVAGGALVLALRRRPIPPQSALVLTGLATLVAVPLLLWGNPRFHVPFAPLLAVLNGGAIAAAVHRLRPI